MESERAADTTIGADRVGLVLLRFVPRAGFAHFVFALEHERAGGADADAVSTVDTRGIRKGDVGFGGDPGIESAAGDGNGECVLRIASASFDAFITKDALRVVAHVEIVVDLHGLVHRSRVASIGNVMMARLAGITLTG